MVVISSAMRRGCKFIEDGVGEEVPEGG